MKPSPAATTTVEELATAAAQGDSDALGSLYDQLADQVVRFIRVNIYDHDTALDLASTTWENVAKSIRSYTYQPGTKGFTGWLFTIAGNVMREHRRRLSRRPLERLDGDWLAYGEYADPGATPDEAWEKKMDAHRIAAEVNNLSRDQRQCVMYRFFVGLTTDETAKVMGKTVGAVKQLQHRGLKTLAKRLPQALLTPAIMVPDTVMRLGHTPQPARLEST